MNTVSYGAYLLKQFDVFREINEHERVIGDITHNYFLPLKKWQRLRRTSSVTSSGWIWQRNFSGGIEFLKNWPSKKKMFERQVEENKISGFGTSISEIMFVDKCEDFEYKTWISHTSIFSFLYFLRTMCFYV